MSAAEQWERVSYADFMADVEKARRERYRMVPHQAVKRKRVAWPICKECGLIYLRNRATAHAIKLGCLHEKFGKS